MKDVISLKKFQELQPQRDVDKQLRKAAEMYEQQFLGQMVKAMRATVDKSGLSPESMSEKIYGGYLDQEYVKSWIGRGGVGLSDLIVDQLKTKMQQQLQPLPRPKGPLPLENKKNFQLKENSAELTKADFQIGMQDASHIVSPWDGEVINHFQHEGQTVVDMAFDNGLKGRFLFSSMPKVSNGHIAAGETLTAAPVSNFHMQLS